MPPQSETPEGFLLVKPFPGANSCILIGRVPELMRLPAETCGAVLWIVDGAAAAKPPARLPAGAISVLAVDDCSAAQLEKAIDEFLLKSPKQLPSLYVTRLLPPEKEAQFAMAIDTVVACVESHHRTRVTRQQDAFAWQSYLLENLPSYVHRRLPERWKGALAGVPAFVCGAGPSLDVSGRILAGVAARGVVFAADSSLRALAKLQVQPDFAVSLDVAKTPAKCLVETSAPRRVVLSATSPPEWSGAIPAARRFYVSSNQITLDWLAAQGIARTTVEVRENCGATAIELARFLGCSPICLFGMDLSLSGEGALRRHHESADASTYVNSGFNAQQQFPRVPGNFSPEVPTHVIGDWRELDRRLATWPVGLVWVVTDRGARLRNTWVSHPEQFVLPVVEANKEQRLTELTEPVLSAVNRLQPVADKLTRFGRYLVQSVPSLRSELEAQGPDSLVAALRGLFAQPENGQMLGAYSLKLMPHLLPPISQDAAFWRTLLSELEQLGQRTLHGAALLAK